MPCNRCELLERVLDALDDAVTVSDASGAIAFQNRVARELASGAPTAAFVLVKEAGVQLDGRPCPGATAVGSEPQAGKVVVRRSVSNNPIMRRALDAQRHCISVRDAAGNTEFVNQWWRNVTGASPADGRETSSCWLHYIHPEDLPGLLAFQKGLSAASQEVRYDYRLKTRSGGYRWQLGASSPLRDSTTGEVLQWFEVAIDIHELKEAQRQLAEERQLLDTIMDQLPVAVGVALPPSCRVVRNNRIGCKMFPTFDMDSVADVDDLKRFAVWVGGHQWRSAGACITSLNVTPAPASRCSVACCMYAGTTKRADQCRLMTCRLFVPHAARRWLAATCLCWTQALARAPSSGSTLLLCETRREPLSLPRTQRKISHVR